MLVFKYSHKVALASSFVRVYVCVCVCCCYIIHTLHEAKLIKHVCIICKDITDP